MTYTPESVIANNQDSMYYPADRQTSSEILFCHPVLPSEQVRFTADDGSIIIVPLNSRGSANTVVGPHHMLNLFPLPQHRNESGFTNFTSNTITGFVTGPSSYGHLRSSKYGHISQGLNGNHQSNVTLILPWMNGAIP
ncbi:MAG: hypothetical protein R2741_10320 [Methanolobus sp.]